MIRVLQPLRPQSPARVVWETKLLDLLSLDMECSHGDAAGFLDAHQSEVDELYAAGARPAGAAEVLLHMDAGV